MFRANYPVEKPSSYRELFLYLVFLNHLVEQISKQVISGHERFGFFFVFVFVFASLLSPSSVLSITSTEIVDRLFNVYHTDLPLKVDFVDEVERWKIRWALVNNKPETTLTLHATNRDLYPAIYSIICILLTMPSGVIGNKREIFQSNHT